jgi:glyoxylase I family protein
MDNNFIGIHHASLVISDIEQARYFYHDVLGLAVNSARPDLSFDGLWLDVNEYQQIHLLLVDNPDSIKRPKHGGRDRHTALKVKSLSIIQVHLDQDEIAYSLSQSGRKALFCRDPDGNTLEIME